MGRLNWKLGQGKATEPLGPIWWLRARTSYLNDLNLKDISQGTRHITSATWVTWPMKTKTVSVMEALVDSSVPGAVQAFPQAYTVLYRQPPLNNWSSG